MKHIKIDSLPQDYEVCHLGDLHGFVRGFPFNTVKKVVKDIASRKHCYVSLGGDMIDTMLPQDKRYVHGQNEGKYERTDQQIKGVMDLLSPLSGRVLWGIQGNHEFRVINILDATKMLLEGLGCDIYNGEDENSSYTLVADLGENVKIIDWHGFPSVRSRAGTTRQRRVNSGERIKRLLMDLGGVDDCNVAIMHHIHRMFIVPPTSMEELKMVSVNGRMKAVYPQDQVKKFIGKDTYYYDSDDRWYASSGAFFPSYVEGFSTYSERRGYNPSEMGYVKTVVKKGKVHHLEEVKV